MDKEKQKRQQSSGSGIVFYLLFFLFLSFSCAAICGFLFTFPAGCTWDRNGDNRPQLIDPPPNSTLVSNIEVRQGSANRNSITKEYAVNDASLGDVVSYYENEAGSECRVYTVHANCFGPNPNLGNYIIHIAYSGGQLTLNYSITWYKCRIGWRFQD